MGTTARDLLWPSNPDLLARVVFLYVGQGASTIILAADGRDYKTALLDIHLDEGLGGIDVPRLMADLLAGGRLDLFVNSHPHNDHTRGVEKLHDAVGIGAVWHSGHIPSGAHEGAHQELQRVIAAVRDAGGEEEELCGSRTPRAIGEAECYILSPAQHVKDDIADETPEGRDRRIHEHCAVLRVGAGDTWVMLPGDADRDAWEQHITAYYGRYGKLASRVLAAAHHGSRTFFKHDEDDEPYLDALVGIDPDYVVISAPRREESPHGHPHEDAVALYAGQVGADDILHTGTDQYSYILDLYRDGQYQIDSDHGALAEEYGLKDGGGGDGGSQQARRAAPAITFPRTRVDDRPMGGRS